MAKLFGTDGVRGVANQYPMTAEFALSLAKACATLICTAKHKVVIAKDTRVSGDMLESAMTAGFTAQGVDVLHLGVLPTPALTSLTADFGVDMAVMITASHNPYTDNGIKLLNGQGDRFDDQIIEQLEILVENNNFPTTDKIGRVDIVENPELAYMERAAQALNGQKLTGLRVVLDCANGAFYKILPEVFMKLGAGVITIGNQPNGCNINQNCGSQHTELLAETVRNSHAQMGIAVDGDGDRIIICDENGTRLDGDQIIAFLAQTLQEQNRLRNNCVVATIMSNVALDKHLAARGITTYRSKVGEKNVIVKMREVGANLGGEESGHMVLSDFSHTGDGMVTALTVALGFLHSGKKMSEIFPVFKPYPCAEVDTYFADKSELAEASQNPDILAKVEQIRQNLGADGSIIFRRSGTEPLIKVKITGADYETVKQLNERVRAMFAPYQIVKIRVVK